VDNKLQGSISPTFNSKLLRAQILKAQKIHSSCQSFFALLGSVHVKALGKMLVKLTPEGNDLSSSCLINCKKKHFM